MWWNSSSYGRRHSPTTSSLSDAPFSSNLELYNDPDPDWVGGQLEEARLQRSGFYRRLHSAIRRSDDDIVAHQQRPRNISPDDVDDTASVSTFEPHSSWRFYSSFDNGEWTRHAVPVLKVEEATIEVTPKPKISEVKKSACQAAESSIRRSRQPRTTAAELQQNRLRMRSGESMDGSAYGRWKLSNSNETLRNTATGDNISSKAHRSLDFMDEPPRRVLSPMSDRFSPWREATSPDVTVPPRSRLDSGSSPKERLLVSSCTVNGVDVTFKDKVIIPTKYKTKENNTAAGSPEASKAEVLGTTSVEPESGYNSDKVLKRCGEDPSVNCMTGQDEVQIVKPSEKGDMVLHGKVESTRQENPQRTVELEPPEVNSAGHDFELANNCDLKHDQFAIGSKFIEENNFDEFSEIYGTTKNEKNQKLKSKAETVHMTLNRSTNGARENEKITEKKEIILENGLKSHEGESLLREKTSDNAENKLESPIGRGLDEDEKHIQTVELTSKMATDLVTSDKNLSSSGEKIVKFISFFYADVNKDPNKEPCNTKNNLVNSTAMYTVDNSSPAVDVKGESTVSCQEDDNWVVEVAVKN